jgi:hypothetical protein
MKSLESRIVDQIKDAKNSGKTVLLPEVRRFDEIFSDASLNEDYKSGTIHSWKVDELLPYGKINKGTGVATVQSFCGVYTLDRKYKHLRIVPNEKTIQLIEANMLLGDGYNINFQINVRDNKCAWKGTALVSAHYNMICGSRWFAVIDASTIPR